MFALTDAAREAFLSSRGCREGSHSFFGMALPFVKMVGWTFIFEYTLLRTLLETLFYQNLSIH